MLKIITSFRLKSKKTAFQNCFSIIRINVQKQKSINQIFNYSFCSDNSHNYKERFEKPYGKATVETQLINQQINRIQKLKNEISNDQHVVFEYYNSMFELADYYQHIYTFQDNFELVNFHTLDDLMSEDLLQALETISISKDNEMNWAFTWINFHYNKLIAQMMKSGKEIEQNTLDDWIKECQEYMNLLIKAKWGQSGLLYVEFYFFLSIIYFQRRNFEQFEQYFEQGFREYQIQLSSLKEKTEWKENLKHYISDFIAISTRKLRVNLNASSEQSQQFYSLCSKVTQELEKIEETPVVDSFEQQLLFCDSLLQKEKNNEALQILEKLYDSSKHQNKEQRFLFLIIYYVALDKTGNKPEITANIQHEIDNISTQSFDLTDCKYYGLIYHQKQFLREQSQDNFSKLDFRLNELLDCYNHLFQQSSILGQDAMRKLSNLIEQIMIAQKIPHKKKYLSLIFQLLKSVQPSGQDQISEFELKFWLMLFSFFHQESENISKQHCLTLLDQFFEEYKSIETLQQIFFSRLFSVFTLMIDRKLGGEVETYISKTIQLIQSNSKMDRNLSKKLIEILNEFLQHIIQEQKAK